VLEALGSCLVNKYSEGYPGARFDIATLPCETYVFLKILFSTLPVDTICWMTGRVPGFWSIKSNLFKIIAFWAVETKAS